MIFIGLAGLLFGIDYFVKKKAEETLKEGVVREVANDRILLRKLHNPGVAFGWFRNNKKVTVLLSSLLIGGTIARFWELLFKKGMTITKLGYALLIGGGLNNLYERFHQGYVTDYFSFNVKWDKLKRLVFNLSDLFIFAGVILVGIGKLISSKKS